MANSTPPGLTYPTDITGLVPPQVEAAFRMVFDNLTYLRGQPGASSTEGTSTSGQSVSLSQANPGGGPNNFQFPGVPILVFVWDHSDATLKGGKLMRYGIDYLQPGGNTIITFIKAVSTSNQVWALISS